MQVAAISKTAMTLRFAFGTFFPVLLQAMALNRLFWELVRFLMAFSRNRERKETSEEPEFKVTARPSAEQASDWYNDTMVGGTY